MYRTLISAHECRATCNSRLGNLFDGSERSLVDKG